tara:strand:+ start:121 stop:468 length:348 start_codon:yes stop_codon:yes gene_type:complete
MIKYLFIPELFFTGWDNRKELTYLNIKSLNVEFKPGISNLISGDNFYVNKTDYPEKILTLELLSDDTALVANACLPSLYHYIHYYECIGIELYSEHVGNPINDANIITINFRLRQ